MILRGIPPKLLSKTFRRNLSYHHLPCSLSLELDHRSGSPSSIASRSLEIDNSFLSFRTLSGMYVNGAPPSRNAIYLCLHRCTVENDIVFCRQIHSLMTCCSLDFLSVLGDQLIRLFASSESLFESLVTFCRIVDPTVYTWNAIMSAFVRHGEFALTIHLYGVMQEEGVQPNAHIFSCILKACGSLKMKSKGEFLHDEIIKFGYDSDGFTGSALIDMYVKCGSGNEAQNVLRALETQDVVPWNALISGYAHHGYGLLALEVYEEMQHLKIKAVKVTLSSVLKACSIIGALHQGMLIHDYIIRLEVEMDAIIGGSIINMYAKCGRLVEATVLLNSSPCMRTIENWNALLVGCVQHENFDLSIELYENMQAEGTSPDSVSFCCFLRACCYFGKLGWGRDIHDKVVRDGLDMQMVVGSALIELYAKHGLLSEACKIFDALPHPTSIAWYAFIRGCMVHGCSDVALALLEEMQGIGFDTDKPFFICSIQACGNRGAIKQGRLLHCHIVQNALDCDIDVCSSLISMYANCGDFETAQMVLKGLPKHDAISCSALICVCVEQGHFVQALQVYEDSCQHDIVPDQLMCSCIMEACLEVGAVHQCNQILMQIFESGFDKGPIVRDALVKMYVRCGRLEDAYKVVTNGAPSLSSWNAVIEGCVQHGNSNLARRCFLEMQIQGMQPDARTFTNTLAACCRTGETEDGLEIFKLMESDFHMKPCVEHVNCLVDLLGRAGWLNDAEALIQRMPDSPDVIGWRSLLASSSKFGNPALGKDCQMEIAQILGMQETQTE